MENERKRILELVKQGIISTEEALTLLENISKKKVKQRQKKIFVDLRLERRRTNRRRNKRRTII